MAKVRNMVRTCRVCGCTDERACDGGCWWLSADDDLCSTCEPAAAHVFTVTRGHYVVGYRSKRKTFTCIATCSCQQFSAELPRRYRRKMAERIREHLKFVVHEAHDG